MSSAGRFTVEQSNLNGLAGHTVLGNRHQGLTLLHFAAISQKS